MSRGADMVLAVVLVAGAVGLLMLVAFVGGMLWMRIVGVGLFGLGVLLIVRARRPREVRR